MRRVELSVSPNPACEVALERFRASLVLRASEGISRTDYVATDEVSRENLDACPLRLQPSSSSDMARYCSNACWRQEYSYIAAVAAACPPEMTFTCFQLEQCYVPLLPSLSPSFSSSLSPSFSSSLSPSLSSSSLSSLSSPAAPTLSSAWTASSPSAMRLSDRCCMDEPFMIDVTKWTKELNATRTARCLVDDRGNRCMATLAAALDDAAESGLIEAGVYRVPNAHRKPGQGVFAINDENAFLKKSPARWISRNICNECGAKILASRAEQASPLSMSGVARACGARFARTADIMRARGLSKSAVEREDLAHTVLIALAILFLVLGLYHLRRRSRIRSERKRERDLYRSIQRGSDTSPKRRNSKSRNRTTIT